jgi:hypothetical protein
MKKAEKTGDWRSGSVWRKSVERVVSKEPPSRPSRNDAETDVAVLCHPTEDQSGVRILRARKGRLETGELRAVREGQPLMGGELVKLHPRTGRPWMCDVEVLHGGDEAAREPADAAERQAKGGPSTVATEAYRDNWERIFRSPDSPAKGSNPKRRGNASLN